MLRRLALASSLVALSAVSFAGKAQAQSVNVGFGGVVGTACTFGTPTAGNFVVVPGTTTPGSAIEASNVYGTPATLTVTCTTASSIAVGNPVPANAATTTLAGAAGYTAAAAILDTAVPATVIGSPSATPALGRTASTKLPVPTGGARNLQVRMGASTTAAIAAGTYSYNAVISVVP